MFPHHENERAQAVADGKEFARHWMHNGWVTMGGEKMSKSLGNFTSLSDLLDRSDARAYRLLVLRSHYRSPIEVTPDTIAQAEAGLARLDELARRFGLDDPLADGPVVDRAGRGRCGPVGARAGPGGGGRASARAWTTTSTPPGPWPPSSTWPGGPTLPPTPATTSAAGRAGRTVATAGRGARPPPAPGRGRGGRPGDRRPGAAGATRPGRGATGPRPTPAGRARGGRLAGRGRAGGTRVRRR